MNDSKMFFVCGQEKKTAASPSVVTSRHPSPEAVYDAFVSQLPEEYFDFARLNTHLQAAMDQGGTGALNVHGADDTFPEEFLKYTHDKVTWVATFVRVIDIYLDQRQPHTYIRLSNDGFVYSKHTTPAIAPHVFKTEEQVGVRHRVAGWLAGSSCGRPTRARSSLRSSQQLSACSTSARRVCGTRCSTITPRR